MIPYSIFKPLWFLASIGSAVGALTLIDDQWGRAIAAALLIGAFLRLRDWVEGRYYPDEVDGGVGNPGSNSGS